MLQQTQVTTVIPYFERWMEAFPDIASLATAPLDDVLSAWSGLGYYARARNLHKAARKCEAEHGGELPLKIGELCALPGIGESTANAIISQSTDQPAAVLDGNVRRVLARHAAIDGWTGKSAVQRQLWIEAESRLPSIRGADYTQASMDLGALVCKRSNPDCRKCPVSVDCQALMWGKVDQLPARKPKAKVSDKTVYMLVIRDDKERVLLERRPPAGIWGGLWCLPEGGNIESIKSNLGVSTEQLSTLPPIEHRLSHVRMTIYPVLATVTDARQVKCSGHRDWFDKAGLRNLGLPKPVADLLSRPNNGEFA